MVRFPIFGKAKFLATKLKLCGEAKVAEDFEALRAYAEEGLEGIPEGKADRFVNQRRGLFLALADAAHNLGEDDVALEAVEEAIEIAGGEMDFVPVLFEICDYPVSALLGCLAIRV